MSKILYWMFLILLFSCTSDREKTTPNEAEIFQRASHFYNKENFEKSLKCFDSLISINPLNGFLVMACRAAITKSLMPSSILFSKETSRAVSLRDDME